VELTLNIPDPMGPPVTGACPAASEATVPKEQWAHPYRPVSRYRVWTLGLLRKQRT